MRYTEVWQCVRWLGWIYRNGSDASSENFMVVGETATMVHDLAISDEHAAGEM